MAERRMFAKSIIDSDLFLDMPLSTQALYFHLSMRADDDGFLNNAKKIRSMVGATEDDLKLLIAKGFVITFETGIVVIRHWKVHNYIQKDRYKSTMFKQEKEQLTIENGIYMLCIQDISMLDTKCIQAVPQMDTQDRKGKVIDRKDKISKETSCMELESTSSIPIVIQLILNDKTFYSITQKDVDEWQSLYPATNVIQELRKMKGWCDSNPSKRKTKRGIKAFITNWLAREQDKGGVKVYGTNNKNTESTSSARLW